MINTYEFTAEFSDGGSDSEVESAVEVVKEVVKVAVVEGPPADGDAYGAAEFHEEEDSTVDEAWIQSLNPQVV
jgi:hypothetical protein